MINHKLIKGLNHFSPVYQDDANGEGYVEPHFSWFRSGCDACNSTLGGDCYDVRCRLDDDTITEISVCTDCYIELCS